MAEGKRTPDVVFDRRPGQSHRSIIGGAWYPAFLMGIVVMGLVPIVVNLSLDRVVEWRVIAATIAILTPPYCILHEFLHWAPLRLAGYPVRIVWRRLTCYVEGDAKIPRWLMLITLAFPFTTLSTLIIVGGFRAVTWASPLGLPITVGLLFIQFLNALGSLQDCAEFWLLVRQPRGSMVCNRLDRLEIFRPDTDSGSDPGLADLTIRR